MKKVILLSTLGISFPKSHFGRESSGISQGCANICSRRQHRRAQCSTFHNDVAADETQQATQTRSRR